MFYREWDRSGFPLLDWMFQNEHEGLDMRNWFLLSGPGWIAAILAIGIPAQANQTELEDRWWPLQALPKGVVRTSKEFPAPRLAFEMMIQSVAGLAARAVNEKKGDELVWVESGNLDLNDWLARWLAMHPNIETSGPLGPWELVD